MLKPDENVELKPLNNTLKLLLTEKPKGKTLLEKFFDNSLIDKEILDYNSGLCTQFQAVGGYFVGDYNDKQYVRKDAINNFASYLAPMLSDACLFQLTQRFLKAEGLQCSGTSFLRNSSLAKAFLNELIRRHLALKNEQILYRIMSFYFDDCIGKHITSPIGIQGLISVIIAPDIDRTTLNGTLSKGNNGAWERGSPLLMLITEHPAPVQHRLEEIRALLISRQQNRVSAVMGDEAHNNNVSVAAVPIQNEFTVSGPNSVTRIENYYVQLQDLTQERLNSAEAIFAILLQDVSAPLCSAARLLKEKNDLATANDYELFMDCLKPMLELQKTHHPFTEQEILTNIEKMKFTLIDLKGKYERYRNENRIMSTVYGLLSNEKYLNESKMIAAVDQALTTVRFAEEALARLRQNSAPATNI
jgi:hypothetical protein